MNEGFGGFIEGGGGSGGSIKGNGADKGVSNGYGGGKSFNDAGDLGWNHNDLFSSDSDREGGKEASNYVQMDDSGGAVQSKGKDSSPKDPDTALATFRARAKSAIHNCHLRRLANNEGAGLNDEIDNVFVAKSTHIDPIKYNVD